MLNNKTQVPADSQPNNITPASGWTVVDSINVELNYKYFRIILTVIDWLREYRKKMKIANLVKISPHPTDFSTTTTMNQPKPSSSPRYGFSIYIEILKTEKKKELRDFLLGVLKDLCKDAESEVTIWQIHEKLSQSVFSKRQIKHEDTTTTTSTCSDMSSSSEEAFEASNQFYETTSYPKIERKPLKQAMKILRREMKENERLLRDVMTKLMEEMKKNKQLKETMREQKSHWEDKEKSLTLEITALREEMKAYSKWKKIALDNIY